MSPPVSTPSAPDPTPTVPADVPSTGPNLRHAGERPPVEPVAATQHTAAGAKAFAEFFIKTIDWGYATTSSTYMRHYFESSCVACRSAADAIDRAKNAHHHFIGDRFSIVSSAPASSRGSELSVVVRFDVTSGEVVDTNNKFVDAEPALTGYTEHLYMTWHVTGWRVSEMIPKAS